MVETYKFLEYMKIQLFMQIIKQITCLLWVIVLCKELMTLHYMQKKIYSQNFIQPSTKFVLSLHYNGDNSYLFVNGKQELKFKTKTESLVK